MKILHIIDTMGLGGAQTLLKGIFEKQKDNSDIFLYTLRKKEINIKIEHKNIFNYNSKNKFSFPLLKLRKFIKENDIKILHCHLPKSQIIGGLLKTLFFPKIKLVYHEHTSIFTHHNKIYSFLINIFRNKVDIYIAISEYIKNSIINNSKYDENKIIILYNFVDLNKFKKITGFDIKSKKINYGFDEKDFLIGFAARFIKRKGWFEFVQAAKMLKDKGYDFKYLIAGDGEDKNKIIDFIKKHNLENEIKLIGYVEDMNEFYNTIDIFVFPSHWEPLGLTGLEANASSCSLIASDIPGLNEITIDNKNAMLFKKENAYDLMGKIVEMYEEDDIKEKLIKSGLKEVKNYSLENYLEKLEKIYG